MKTTLMFLLLGTGLLFGQTPVSTDFDTNAFLKEISHNKHYKIKKVYDRRIEWRKEDLYGFEDGIYEWENGIFENDSIKKYLTAADIQYIKQQYEQDTITAWQKTELKSFNLIDSLKREKIYNRSLRKRRQGSHFYTFSTPLVNIKGDIAMIKESFECGYMCTSSCIDIYRKDPATHKWYIITSYMCIEV